MIFLRILKNIFGALALFIFALSMLLVFPFYFFVFAFSPKDRAPHRAHRYITRNWARFAQLIFLMRINVQNRKCIDPSKTYVFVANHQSLLDIPLFALASGNTFRFVAKAELTKIPLMGYIIRKLYISVNRTDRADRNRVVEVMRKSLEAGISVFLCPEGTRNRHREPPVMELRDGTFRLAIITKTPLAVLTVLNSGEILSPLRPIELRPGTIHAIWDEPIDTSNMTLDDVPALRDRVREMMTQHVVGWRARHGA